ncbi:hypothetical protein V8C40DRAFT_18083 [Trichoderma camerunense]
MPMPMQPQTPLEGFHSPIVTSLSYCCLISRYLIETQRCCVDAVLRTEKMCSIPRRGLRSIFDADARLHVIVSDVIYNHDGVSRRRQEQYSRRYRTVVFAHESDKEQKCNGETGCRFDQTGRVVLPGCALAGGNSLRSGESSSISVLSRCDLTAGQIILPCTSNSVTQRVLAAALTSQLSTIFIPRDAVAF